MKSSSTENSAVQQQQPSSQQTLQTDKKRSYQDFVESNSENTPQQDSERKRRKQLLPHKMDSSEEKPSSINLRDNKGVINNQNANPNANAKTMTNGQQQTAKLEGRQALPVKSFKAMKEQQKQQQTGANYDSFFGSSISNNNAAKVLPNNRVQQQAKNNSFASLNKNIIVQQSKQTYQQSQFQPGDDVDSLSQNTDNTKMDVDQEHTLVNNRLQKKHKNQQQFKQQQEQQSKLLNQKFNENMNLRSIDEIDQSLLKQNEQNKYQKRTLAESLKYLNLQELPKDWSLKTSLEISCVIKSESEPVNIQYGNIQKYMQYYVYSTDQRVSGFDRLIDKDQLQLQQKIQWLRSLRDVYQKFLQSATDERTMRGVDMPFFYVRNNSFIALFKIEDGKPTAIVNPSKNLAKIIQDSNVIKTVVNISHDDDEERERQQQRLQQRHQHIQQQQQDESDDEKIDDQDRLNFLLDDNNHQNEHFNLVVKNQSQLYYFDAKAVQTIYNILANYIANQMDQPMYSSYQATSQTSAYAQIIAPQPFINCTYNEGQVFYSGNVAYANKQVKYQLKIFGVFFPFHLSSLCQVLRSSARTTTTNTTANKTHSQSSNTTIEIKQQQLHSNNKQNDETGSRDIDVQMMTDEQSRLFSYKKCIKHIKLNTNGFSISNNNGVLGAQQEKNNNSSGQNQQQQVVQYKVMLE